MPRMLTATAALLIMTVAAAQPAVADHHKKAQTVYVAASPAAAPAYYMATAPAYLSATAPTYYPTAAPALYSPAPTYYYVAPKHGKHHKSAVTAVVPSPLYFAPAGYATSPMTYATAPTAYAPAAPTAYAPAPTALSPTGYYASAPGMDPEPDDAGVLKLTPSARDTFLRELRSAYANIDPQTKGLARVAALRDAAQKSFLEYRGTSGDDASELSQAERDKIDEFVDQIVQEENDRADEKNARYTGEAPRYYYPYGGGQPTPYYPKRYVRYR